MKDFINRLAADWRNSKWRFWDLCFAAAQFYFIYMIGYIFGGLYHDGTWKFEDLLVITVGLLIVIAGLCLFVGIPVLILRIIIRTICSSRRKGDEKGPLTKSP